MRHCQPLPPCTAGRWHLHVVLSDRAFNKSATVPVLPRSRPRDAVSTPGFSPSTPVHTHSHPCTSAAPAPLCSDTEAPSGARLATWRCPPSPAAARLLHTPHPAVTAFDTLAEKADRLARHPRVLLCAPGTAVQPTWRGRRACERPDPADWAAGLRAAGAPCRMRPAVQAAWRPVTARGRLALKLSKENLACRGRWDAAVTVRIGQQLRKGFLQETSPHVPLVKEGFGRGKLHL